SRDGRRGTKASLSRAKPDLHSSSPPDTIAATDPQPAAKGWLVSRVRGTGSRMPTRRPKKGTTVHLPSDVEAFLASRGARPDRGGSDRCWSQELAKNLNFLEAVLEATNIRLDKSSQRAALDLIGEPWAWELEDLLLMEARF